MNWLSKDGKIILFNRAVRSIGHGFLAVIFGIYLREIGFGAFSIGILLTATLIGSSIFTILAGKLSVNYGIRKILIFSLLMSIAGVSVFLFTQNFNLLIIGATIGFISVTGRELGPFLSLDQSYLSFITKDSYRTKLFSIYYIVTLLAASLGFLLASVPVFLQNIGIDRIISFKFMFLFYIILNISSLIYYSRIKEIKIIEKKAKLSNKTKKIIAKICTLYAFDSFAGGFIIASIISLWLSSKFGLSLSTISIVFFITGILESLSYYLSHKISERIGLIATMTLPHFISNIFLILMAFAYNAYLAVFLYILYSLFSQMDVPPRQSYIIAVVKPHEKSKAASYTNVTKVLATSAGPVISGKLLSSSTSLSFVVAGIIKIFYDVFLYINFIHLRPPEEKQKLKNLNMQNNKQKCLSMNQPK